MKRNVIYIAVAIVVGLAGLGGWRLYKQKVNKSQTPPEITTNTSNLQNTQNIQTDNKQYLVIKEWGVKMLLPASLSDAKYKPNGDGTGMYLSTAKLEDIEGCENGQVVAVERAKENELIGPSDVNSIKANNPNALTKVDDYYYLFTASPMMCTSDPASQDYLKDMRSSFSEAIKTLSPI